MERAKSPATRRRVLVVPFPVTGRTIPTLHFAKHVASKGIQITFILSPRVRQTVKLPASSSSISFAVISDGSEEERFNELENFDACSRRYRHAFTSNLVKYIDEERSKNEEGFAVMVYDSTMPWLLELAHDYGMLGASFFAEAAAVNALCHHINEGNLEFPYGNRKVSLPCLPVFESRDLPYLSEDSNGVLFTRSLADQFANLKSADWVFFNTFHGLESEVLSWFEEIYPIKTIGPTLLLPHSTPPLEPKREAYTEWLDSNQASSVVFVSCGSILPLLSLQMEELAYGLLASNHEFLWVVRDSEFEKLPENFVAQLTPEKGMIVNWCDQIGVLSHPAVSCFVTHCGWNSAIEAISHGVPMIGFGIVADQITNAKLIQDLWGVGIRLSGRGYDTVVGREEIAMRIQEVVRGEKAVELKKNCLKWNELARDAVSEGGTSLKNVEDFVQNLLA